ncbi:20137_t:CDS:1, partial [Racocetra fulgida]
LLIVSRVLELKNLPVAFQDPAIVTAILRALPDIKKEMPALVFQWNDAGFNDVPATPNCRNGIAGQTKVAFIGILVENGAKNWNDCVLTFPDGTSIGTWKKVIPAWYETFFHDLDYLEQ